MQDAWAGPEFGRVHRPPIADLGLHVVRVGEVSVWLLAPGKCYMVVLSWKLRLNSKLVSPFVNQALAGTVRVRYAVLSPKAAE